MISFTKYQQKLLEMIPNLTMRESLRKILRTFDVHFSSDDHTHTATYVGLLSGAIKLADLNAAPANAAATGVKGEVRVCAEHIYVCTATDTWVRVAIATWS